MKARLANATPGAWRVVRDDRVQAVVSEKNGIRVNILRTGDGVLVSEADAEFIAHAKQDMALLIAAYEWLYRYASDGWYSVFKGMVGPENQRRAPTAPEGISPDEYWSGILGARKNLGGEK